jgi:hypothetical protein
MGRKRASLPTKSAVKRSRVAIYVCGVLAVTSGAAGLSAGQFAYTSRFGLGSPPFLIAFGLFFLAFGILWHPKTQD